MFCINSLSDTLTDEPSEDDALEQLFGSPLFTLLSNSQALIPLKSRRTAVNLIGMCNLGLTSDRTDPNC